jgi:hypothetical protein
MFNTAVQSLQNYCIIKADILKKVSLLSTESIAQELSKKIRILEKDSTLIMAKGSDLVGKMQSFCVSVTNKNLRSKKTELKTKKGDGFISKLFGTSEEKRNNTQNKNSMSMQE